MPITWTSATSTNPVTGTITSAASTVVLDARGYRAFSCVISGTWTATLQAQVSLDSGATWNTMECYSAASGTPITNITVNGTYGVIVNGAATQLKIRASAFTSGTATVTLEAFPQGQLSRPSNAYNFTNISTNVTTTAKSGAGILHAITINTRGVASTATVYDNTIGAAPTIATVDTVASVTTLIYDLVFNTGLTVVAAGTTAANITVSWL